jgi:DeoR/GlpR family transcriptional regulator of sugar metabolism/ABC-type sugar transport system substrate-binding protein
MAGRERQEQIIALVEQRGFVSVKELSDLCGVSEMTIRRDLQRLAEQKRVQRTYGGVMARSPRAIPVVSEEQGRPALPPEGSVVDRVDVLITSSVDPKYDRILLDRVEKRNIPIIAESLAIGREETVVAVDNYQAGVALGRWVGHYAHQHWAGRAYVLDLSYRLSNTQARSQGFLAGLMDVLPGAEMVLSINAQSQYKTAYELTTDALMVHPNINLIFAVNDTMAWGAIQACKHLGREPGSLLVVPFGLEGNTLRNALTSSEYCQVGLAMFPEIVGPVCVEAAIAAYNHEPLPRQLITPHAILTPQTLFRYYNPGDACWQIQWAEVQDQLPIPLDLDGAGRETTRRYPRRIGFIIPFGEHEWYRNLVTCMKAYAAARGIELEIVDADRSLKSEMDLRRREIARLAAEQVRPGEVVLIDAGQIAAYLAEELAHKPDLTVITNSLLVFDALREHPNITLISTGGLLRHSTESLIGPTAEAALRELRADKLFLVVTGITLEFGLSHTNMAEVTMKQAMIRAAREVVLLADHAIFGQESVVQVAPIGVVHRLVTDEALPASTRLELTKLGIEVMVARV